MRYQPPTPDTVMLVEHQGRLEALAPGETPGRGVRTSWETFVVKGGAASLRGLPLLRALGGARRVVDATAGLGTDAWTMALAGVEVTMWERSPILAALLRDGLRWMRGQSRSEWREAAQRMTLVEGDARSLPEAQLPPGAVRPEVVYVDPMFPPKRRSSALASRQVRFIGAMVGEDPDAAELLAAARRAAGERVVVKRPHHAPVLAPGASHSLRSTLIRFDVYLAGGPAT